MLTHEQRKRRKADVTARAAQPNHMYSYCRIIGCRHPARAGTSDGLDTRYCRRHSDHYQRHGDPLKASYPATIINPYRRAAYAWLTANADDVWVVSAVASIQSLYNRAGSDIEAFRLRGLTPRVRAYVAWARLREAGIDPVLPLTAWLAVEMAVREDFQPSSRHEFKCVQAAKIVHRLASGTHRRWFRERWGERIESTEMHVYPRSAGRVLRLIGADLEQAAELVVDKHLANIFALKHERDAKHGLALRAHPSRAPGLRRRQSRAAAVVDGRNRV